MTNELIFDNKRKFIELINSIQREGMRKEELISKLENSDFFTAPASTRYHGAEEGGLCYHCLCVYNNLTAMINQKGLEEVINPESVIIVALLHDLSKMNFYKRDYRNKKIYHSNGTKYDNGGSYDWVAEATYSIIPAEERFIYGNHEETAEFMVRQYVPLTYEESIAILSHMGSMAYDSKSGDISNIYNRYPLACLLHLADMQACYIDKA